MIAENYVQQIELDGITYHVGDLIFTMDSYWKIEDIEFTYDPTFTLKQMYLADGRSMIQPRFIYFEPVTVHESVSFHKAEKVLKSEIHRLGKIQERLQNILSQYGE